MYKRMWKHVNDYMLFFLTYNRDWILVCRKNSIVKAGFCVFFFNFPPQVVFLCCRGRKVSNEWGRELLEEKMISWSQLTGFCKNWLLFIFQRVSGLCWLSCLELWEMFISRVLLIFLLTDLRLWAWSLKTFFSIYLDASKHREHCMATGDKGP